MKILLSTYRNPHFTAVNDYVEATLREMGHDVGVFEHYRYRLPGRVRDRVPSLQAWDVRRLNRVLLRTVDETRPDLLLVLGGVTIQPETLARIRRRSVITANWFADYPAHFDYTMAVAPAYDHLFVSDSLSRDRHAAAGHRHVQWLPFGCRPEWADVIAPAGGGAPGAVDPADEAIFVGSWYPERECFLSKLWNCRVAIWGPGWSRRLDDGPLRGAIRGGSLRESEWRRLYQQTPAALNLHYGFGGDPERYGAMANTRVFEIMAAGGCLFSDEKKDLGALFVSGWEFVAFHDAEDCLAKLRYYREHPEERQTIARRGQQSVLARHTYRHRMETLLTIVGGRG